MAEAAEARAQAQAVAALHEQGRFDAALTRVDELAAEHPGSALVLHLAGCLLHFAANRAPSGSEAKSRHLSTAHDFLAEAKRLVPNCVNIATTLVIVLSNSSRRREADREARCAIAITSPVDPAENDLAFCRLYLKRTTREQRVEGARNRAQSFFEMVSLCKEEVSEVLDIGERQGAAVALTRAKELADRFTYSSRAQYFHGYMDLKFARSLDAAMDKRPFLERIRVRMNKAANKFNNSLVLALFYAKICFTLGLYDAAEMECRRAIGMDSPVDPRDEDVPPGSVNGKEYEDRVSSIRGEVDGLLEKLLPVARFYWFSMSGEKLDGFLTMRLDRLGEYYDEVYGGNYWAAKVISDALNSVRDNRSWRFWICPICVGKKFPDTDSFLIHMCNKNHPKRKIILKLLSVLDPKPSGGSASQGDSSLIEIAVCQNSDEHYTFHFKKMDIMFECMFSLPYSRVEPESFSEIRQEKCAKGTEILEEIKKRLNNLPADRSSCEFDNARTEIQDVWNNFLNISVLDYRECILPLAKSFLWSKLIKCMSEDASIASKRIGDADIDVIFPYVADAPGSNPSIQHGSILSDGNKTYHKIGNNKHIKNLKPSISDDTSKKGEEHKQSEVPTADRSSGPIIRNETSSMFVKKQSGTDRRIDFSNVIVQSLWHLKQFRDQLLETSSVHVHVMNGQTACIICALYSIFNSLNEGDDISASSIGTISDNLLPSINASTMGERNAASRALEVILKSLHISQPCMHFDSGPQAVCSQNVDNSKGHVCLAHCQFGINGYEKLKCKNCSKEPRCSKYISFFWKADGSLLKKIEIERFEELLKIWHDTCFCDDENYCSAELNNVDCFLENQPPFFTAVMDWHSDDGSYLDVFQVLIDAKYVIDVSLISESGHLGQKYLLASMICSNAQGIHLLVPDHAKQHWIIYSGKSNEEIDASMLFTRCRRGHLQPEVLFFQAVKRAP